MVGVDRFNHSNFSTYLNNFDSTRRNATKLTYFHSPHVVLPTIMVSMVVFVELGMFGQYRVSMDIAFVERFFARYGNASFDNASGCSGHDFLEYAPSRQKLFTRVPEVLYLLAAPPTRASLLVPPLARRPMMSEWRSYFAAKYASNLLVNLELCISLTVAVKNHRRKEQFYEWPLSQARSEWETAVWGP